MKKLKIFSLILAVCLCFCLCSCRRGNENTVSLVTFVYSDYTLLEDNKEMLMVVVPSSWGGNTIDSVSGAVLPSRDAVNANGESVKVKSGDLIIMDFNESIYIRQETTPKGFVERPKNITVKGENFELTEEPNGFTIAIPFAYIEKIAELSVGVELGFYKNENQVNSGKYAYKTVIKEIRNEKAVVFVNSSQMTEVINCFAFGKVIPIK